MKIDRTGPSVKAGLCLLYCSQDLKQTEMTAEVLRIQKPKHSHISYEHHAASFISVKLFINCTPSHLTIFTSFNMANSCFGRIWFHFLNHTCMQSISSVHQHCLCFNISFLSSFFNFFTIWFRLWVTPCKICPSPLMPWALSKFIKPRGWVTQFPVQSAAVPVAR